MEMEKTVVRDIFLQHMSDEGLDPLLIFAMVMGRENVLNGTSIGEGFVEAVSKTCILSGFSEKDVINVFRTLFHGTKREGKLNICKRRKGNSSETELWRDSKKKVVQQKYLNDMKEKSMFGCLLQIIYKGKDNSSGARVHLIFREPQTCIVECRDMLVGQNPPLGIMEVSLLYTLFISDVL